MNGPPSFAQTWGAQMIAYMLDLVLYGVGMVLVMKYFHSYNSTDSLWTRFAVGVTFFFATVHTVLLSHQIYLDFVIWFDQPAQLNTIPFSATGQLIGIYLTAFSTQIFFASRIWMMAPEGKKILACAPVVVLAVTQIGFGIAQTVLVGSTPLFSELEKTAKITSTQAGCTVACDISITIILCWVLHSSRSRSNKTNSIIDKLIVYAINRGAATSLAAFIQLILFVALPGTFLFMPFLLPSCHLYVISVCSMLISREGLRHKLQGSDRSANFQLSEIGSANNHQHSNPSAMLNMSRNHQQSLQVFKEVTVGSYGDDRRQNSRDSDGVFGGSKLDV
ncbi:hypothetical protein PM082_020062 [Marasmius tenuissimus]|nr:hypothetical protein PM082_020062 [Marasmius tenuissimus]